METRKLQLDKTLRRGVGLSLTVAAMLAASLLVTGCGSLAEKAAEKAIESVASQDGQNVDVDISKEGVTIVGDQGKTEIQAGGGASLPEGFPESLAYPRGELVSAVSTESNGAMSYGVVYSTSDTTDAVYEHYLSALEQAGFAIESKMKAQNSGQTGFTIQAAGDTHSVMIIGGDGQGDAGQAGFTIQLYTK